jgi:hypothetical protein
VRAAARRAPHAVDDSHLISYTDRECGVKIGVVCIMWVSGGMFTIGFRGCDFHEKDACGSAGSASFTATGSSAGSSHAVPALNVTFYCDASASSMEAQTSALSPFAETPRSLPGKIHARPGPFILASQDSSLRLVREG